MTLGEKIFRLRTEQGLSQETFGEKLGVSRQSVSKWETDQSVPELDKIVMISEFFGVSTDYLLKDIGETYSTAEAKTSHTETFSRDEYRIGRRPTAEAHRDGSPSAMWRWAGCASVLSLWDYSPLPFLPSG